ncbi:acetyl-CoA carboxylase biotin carboxyl carrier protein subunit [Pseudomonas sp. R5(2019)]|uniref:acetyl-CoA carboxylase biotin carboxyl carrier protein n=1 Tax=Pseudomonas sp. R5(2019) TaxID=2697566 RepID=UPI0014132E9C|nr:acetyl-CoA carboxylase biotin carboxyl carrier protein subunit [Pseudomonas sp. R5(2019)]NBA94872.1 hypothetical protein [Pseudomonas sp. R5(2019)]
MTPDFIEQVVQMLNKRALRAFEFEQAGACLRLMPGGQALTAPVALAVAPPPTLNATGLGHLRLTHPQRREPCVTAGTSVTAGQVLAFLQTGTLLQPVLAEQAGVIARVLASEGELIGFAQPLFELEERP